MAIVFFSYSHKDEELRDRLEVALSMLKREGLIETWHDRRIVAGSEFEGEISENLEKADVILLLISPDFLASNYCYDIELKRAMERHKLGEARVIPVILRRSDWHNAPFGKLNATPTDGKPIRSHSDLDEAFYDVTKAIRNAISSLSLKSSQPAPIVQDEVRLPAGPRLGPRSSQLRLAKSFSDMERDQFLEDSFRYLCLFFENSLLELSERNRGIETSFRKANESQFSAVIYESGKAVSRCSIKLGGALGNCITYSSSESDNSFNEQLRVEQDDQGLFLKSLGMTHTAGMPHQKLTQEGGAELFWSILIGRLQGK